MSKINRHPVRRTAAGVLASALVLSGAVAAAVPANAAVGFELVRVAGDDRFETSALAVAAFGPATGAILAAGENGRSPDALAASFLAGIRNVPVALTTQNRVTPEVLAALNGLGGKNITIVGGTAAVGESVVTQLRAAGFTVDRVFGANRYETAREIVQAGESAAASNVGLVASGTSTIDALAGGALAFAGKHPMFLVTRDDIPGATLEAIRTSGVTSVYVLGGEAVVSPAVVAQLATAGVTVRERLSGDNRSETSVAIANELIAEHGFSATTFNLASGLNEGVDALSGAALSGKEKRVLLVTQNASTAPAVTGFATTNTTRLTSAGRVFGGTTAVSTTFEAAVETAAVGAPVTGPIALTSATVVQGAALTGTITGDFSAVTVSGCGFTSATIGADSDAATAGRQFSLTVAAAQAAGACTLTFTATPTGGGAAVTQTVSVTVTAAASNQTLAVTAAGTGTISLGDETTSRVYTATGLTAGTEYTVALVDADDVLVAGNQVSFEDDDDNDEYTLATVAAADITVINGTDVTDGDEFTVTPVNGQIQFTVNAEAYGDVVPVVFVDTNDDGDIALGTGDVNTPTEAFGVGPALQVLPDTAEAGALDADADIVEIIAGANGSYTLVLDPDSTGTAGTPEAVTLDANDEYYIDEDGAEGVEGGEASDNDPEAVERVDVEDFIDELSEGDELDADSVFLTNAAFASQWVLEDLSPVAPTGLTATAGEDTASDVELDWAASATESVVSYRVYANDEAVTDTTVTELAVVGTTNAETTELELTNLTASTTYTFVVVAVDESGEESTVAVGSGASGNDNTVEIGTSATVDRATFTDAVLTTDAVVEGAVGADDVYTLTFNEALAALTINDTISVRDADGDSVLLRCLTVTDGAVTTPTATNDFNTDANCVLGDGDSAAVADDTIVVTLAETAEDRNSAGNAGQEGGGITYPLTITGTSGITDDDDDAAPTVAGSADVLINDEE